jgi:molecular chaperone Hsp33
MSDLLLTASAPDAGIAVATGITTALVRDVQSRHGLAPTTTAAVGRLITAAALLGTALKGSERISLQISGDGPVGAISAEAWLLGENRIGARARAARPTADLPLSARGKFDVGGLIGSGQLQVTKSFSIGQPYVGVVPLLSGEIADDVASYLTYSEQIPSVVALGVLANPSGILAAGGIVAQVLPGAHERAIATLERRAAALPPITSLVSSGRDAQELMHEVAGDIPLRAHRTFEVGFACLCTRAKVEVALLSLGRDRLPAMREESNNEAECEYCRKTYVFTAAQIDDLLERTE